MIRHGYSTIPHAFCFIPDVIFISMAEIRPVFEFRGAHWGFGGGGGGEGGGAAVSVSSPKKPQVHLKDGSTFDKILISELTCLKTDIAVVS